MDRRPHPEATRDVAQDIDATEVLPCEAHRPIERALIE